MSDNNFNRAVQFKKTKMAEIIFHKLFNLPEKRGSEAFEDHFSDFDVKFFFETYEKVAWAKALGAGT